MCEGVVGSHTANTCRCREALRGACGVQGHVWMRGDLWEVCGRVGLCVDVYGY